MRRRATASILANPVLVGAVTTLVTIVAVFLAYNANNGLPFVPTRQLKVELANGSELVKGNDVREGGLRVGVIQAMSPTVLPNGQVGALLTLKLDKVVGALPIDSTAVIRPRSALGLKYLYITKGTSSKTFPDGAVMPLAQTSVEVDLDQVYNIFDDRTRLASQVNLKEFGNAFAGRGADLNTTIQRLPRALSLLTPVTRNLSNPSTQLNQFFRQLEITAGVVAPLATSFARTFSTQADTFAAIDNSPQALKDTISKSPSTEQIGAQSFKTQVPFLQHTASFSGYLNVATRELRQALPTLNSALKIGVPVTQRSTSLYGNLQGAMGSLRDLVQAPTTSAALRGLSATVGTLQPQVRFLGPYVTVCNYWNYFWTLVSEHFASPMPQGFAQRALLNQGAMQNNSLTSMGASQPANGEGLMHNPAPGISNTPQFLHGSGNAAAVTNSGQADCEAGQRGYINGSNAISDKYGPARFAHVIVDAHPALGYRAGGVYQMLVNGVGVGRGPDQVPAGETFTREPGGIGAVAP